MDLDALYNACGHTGNPAEYLKAARELEAKNELEAAATAYDRAYSLAPDNDEIAAARREILDRLAVTEHGIVFRYIPAGTFLMGSEDSDPDEQPVHPVRLDAYWVSETPISWTKFCELMDFQPPPRGMPDAGWLEQQSADWKKAVRDLLPAEFRDDKFWMWILSGNSRVCLQYCENETIQARDWHAHFPDLKLVSGEGKEVPGEEVFGLPQRERPERSWGYEEKPMVSASYAAAFGLGLRISTNAVGYRLPTEAEWEKAARGGLIGARYAWGDEAPTTNNCDFGRFEEFSIRKMKAFPSNGYGLYAMCGGVWEWVSDWYDSTYYNQSESENPTGPQKGEEHVLRGGSWADDANVVTVSFRMSSHHSSSPNIGFRLCRVAK